MSRKALCVPVLLALAFGCLTKPPDAPEGPPPEIIENTRVIRSSVSAVLKETPQAVIGAGRLQGVFVGLIFEIRRKGRRVGRVQVSQLWEKECGGWITEQLERFLPGDEAVAEIRPGAGPKGMAEDARPPTVLKPGVIYTGLAAVRAKEGRVALEAGSEAGVKVGMVFNVYADDVYVGRVRVTVVKPKVAGAEVIERREAFKPGYRALHDPEEAAPAASAGPPAKGADTEKMIRELEATIRDPNTKPADRRAALEVLKRLKAERDAKAPPPGGN
ncbi:MAG: hypothetical protein ACYTGB_06740 [Planctomycetota bacterium]|jgi:hypothetical protein